MYTYKYNTDTKQSSITIQYNNNQP